VRSGSSTTRSRDEEYPGLSQGRTGVRHRRLSGLCHARLHSPLRQGPGAATWPTTHDVSRRAGSDVRPQGHAISAFIAEIARHLSALQTSDVPTRHLMCPVHSGGRRRPDHFAGGVPVQSDSRQYAHTTARAQRSSWLVRYRGTFCCKPILLKRLMSGHKEVAQGDRH
jgi:hypothetical protein